MSAFDETTDRRVIPIWTDSTQALQGPEMQRLRMVPEKNSEPDTPQRLREFTQAPSSENALDLLNVASREGNNLDVSAAAELILQDANMPPAVRRLAQQIIRKPDVSSASMTEQASIRLLRKRLQGSIINPLAWADLARLYASAGENHKSERAMLAAVELAGRNRWITRSASRLFVHLGMPDRALDVISRNPFTRTDPWLLAANVAVSQVAGVAPAFWKESKKLLTADLRPVHLGELSSAIATLELDAGQAKQARKLLQQSLIEPTGNVLAQAQWAKRARQVSNLDLSAVNTIDDASEAKCWAAYAAGEMESAVRFAKDWVRDEPYSSRAAVVASYLASLLDDYASIEQVLSIGLRANSDNATLKINRAFCILASGDPGMLDRFKVTPAIIIRDLFNAQKSEDIQTVAHAEATIGLLFYRTGNPEKGKQFYENAERIFEQQQISGAVLLCVQNHLREAILARAHWSLELLARMVKLLSNDAAKVTPGSMFYATTLEKAAKRPDDAENLFKQPSLKDDTVRVDYGRQLLLDYSFVNSDTIVPIQEPIVRSHDSSSM